MKKDVSRVAGKTVLTVLLSVGLVAVPGGRVRAEGEEIPTVMNDVKKIEKTDVPDVSLFTDISPVKYYYVPIQWAVTNGIASGVTRTTICPDKHCTRGQIVTMLYAAYGNDEIAPASYFTDVSDSDYYYEAVNWAVSKGITKGTTSTTFRPEQSCTRAQAMTFLYNTIAKGTISSSASKFSDVLAGSYYYNPVGWAVDKNVTNGTTATSFSPKAYCTRAQIITFLYNAVTGKGTAGTASDGERADNAEKQTGTIREFGLSFQRPDGLSVGTFAMAAGNNAGGVLLYKQEDSKADTTNSADGGTAAWITAPGFIGEDHSRILQFGANGGPTGIKLMMNHIFVTEGPTAVTGTVKPALLYKMDINKYTMGYLTEHQELKNADLNAHRWVIVMGEKSDEADIILSLDADTYSKEDILTFARSIKVDTGVHYSWA